MHPWEFLTDGSAGGSSAAARSTSNQFPPLPSAVRVHMENLTLIINNQGGLRFTVASAWPICLYQLIAREHHRKAGILNNCTLSLRRRHAILPG